MNQKERWASRLGLVLAMAGNAVGLGNFLRFPAQAVRNGGGAFLIPYLVALAVMGLPLIWVEWAMGRYGGQRGHHSTPGIFQSMGRGGVWKYFGTLGLWSCLVIASYYLYIESWCMTYAAKSLVGGFAGMDQEQVEQFFRRLTGERPGSVWAISGWGMGVFALCILINLGILSRGLAGGIEAVAKVGMPLLIVFAALLAVRGLLSDPADDPKVVASPMVGLNFLWEPKFTSLADPSVWLAAAGQIFFTLGIGMGSVHCFASYLRERDDVALNGATAAWTNEFCEVILGGTILLPIAVAYLGLAEVREITGSGSGFALGFFVFPGLFNNWGWLGPVAGFLWFGLLFFAAITSSLAMGQPIMAFFQDEYGMGRGRSTLALGALLLPLAALVAIFRESTFHAEFDYWAGSFGLVVLALAETILFAWVFGADAGWAELIKGADLKIPRAFYYIIKYVTPSFLAVILLGYVFQPAGRVGGEERGWTPYVAAPFTGEAPPDWEWSGGGMIGKLLHRDLAPPEADAPPEARRLHDDVKVMHTIDRAVMVVVFLLLALLVNRAWARNHSKPRGAVA